VAIGAECYPRPPDGETSSTDAITLALGQGERKAVLQFIRSSKPEPDDGGSD
jgi:hypothetical protein